MRWPAEVLAGRVRRPDVTVAPPHGLTLEEVPYPPDDELSRRAAAAAAPAPRGGGVVSGVVTREQLVVQLAAQILALDERRPRAVALTGMSCAGQDRRSPPRWPPWSTAPGRPVVPVAYDDFHHPSEAALPAGPDRRPRATWTTRSTRDALRRLVLDPVAAGGPVRRARVLRPGR